VPDTNEHFCEYVRERVRESWKHDVHSLACILFFWKAFQNTNYCRGVFLYASVWCDSCPHTLRSSMMAQRTSNTIHRTRPSLFDTNFSSWAERVDQQHCHVHTGRLGF
jgi:hypothetical protein